MSGRSIRSEKQKEHTEKVFGKYNADIQAAKELLIHHTSKRAKPKFNNAYLIAYKVAYYIEQCRQNEKPLTEAGVIVALGTDRDTYKRYLSGDMDYIGYEGMECAQSEKDIQIQIEHYKTIDNIQPMFNYLIGNDISLLDSNNIENIDTNDKNTLALSEPLKKARQLISLEREERLAISGKVGDIYTMKAREGEDWQETAQRTEHVLKIEGSNAQAALEQLGYTKEK